MRSHFKMYGSKGRTQAGEACAFTPINPLLGAFQQMFRKIGQVAALFTLFLGGFACDTTSSVGEKTPSEASLRSLDASSQPSVDDLMSFVGVNLDFQLSHIDLPLAGLDIASEWSPGHSGLVLTSLDKNVLAPGLEGDLQLVEDDLRLQLVEGQEVSLEDLNFPFTHIDEDDLEPRDACGHNTSPGEGGDTIYTFFCCKVTREEDDPTTPPEPACYWGDERKSVGCSAYKSCACPKGVNDIKECTCTKVGK